MITVDGVNKFAGLRRGIPLLGHTAVQIPHNEWHESQESGGSEASHPLRGAVFAWVAQPGVVRYSLTHPWLISDHACRRGKATAR